MMTAEATLEMPVPLVFTDNAAKKK